MENAAEERNRNKFTAAFREPAVPQAAVERTVDRVNAYTAGLEAEKQLSELVSPVTEQRKKELAAKAVIGRIAANRRLPSGVTYAQLGEQLVNSPLLDDYVRREPSKLLRDIRSGEIVRSIAASAAIKENYARNVNTEKLLRKDAPDKAPY